MREPGGIGMQRQGTAPPATRPPTGTGTGTGTGTRTHRRGFSSERVFVAVSPPVARPVPSVHTWCLVEPELRVAVLVVLGRTSVQRKRQEQRSSRHLSHRGGSTLGL